MKNYVKLDQNNKPLVITANPDLEDTTFYEVQYNTRPAPAQGNGVRESWSIVNGIAVCDWVEFTLPT